MRRRGEHVSETRYLREALARVGAALDAEHRARTHLVTCPTCQWGASDFCASYQALADDASRRYAEIP